MVLALCVFVSLLGVALQHVFRLASIYTNPFFRILEFVVGALLWLESRGVRRRLWSAKYCMVLAICAILVMVVGITIGVSIPIAPGDPMAYSVIVLPCYACLLVVLSVLDLHSNRVLEYMSGASYAFFLGQFFCYDLSLCALPESLDSTPLSVVCAFAINVVISVAFYELVQKPCKRILLR